MSDSLAQTEDGLRLFVRVVGETGPMVIVPGAAWLEGHLDPLQHAGRRIVFYDTQARGRSEAGPRQRLTFEHEVSDLEAVRRHVGGELVSLIGWSYLGAVVALYASKHPSRVQNLAMLCPMAARPGPFEGMAPYLERNRAREAEMAEHLVELRRLAEGDPSPESWRAFQLLRATIRMDDPAAAERVVANPWQYEQEWAPNVEPTLEALFESLDDFDWATSYGGRRCTGSRRTR